MNMSLPKNSKIESPAESKNLSNELIKKSKKGTLFAFVNCFLIIVCLLLAVASDQYNVHALTHLISPKAAASDTKPSLSPLKETKKGYQVYGYAPHWTFNKLDDVDFNALTTFAYFGVPIQIDGSLDRKDKGYEVFKSDEATRIFQKAHDAGTKVNLTVTIMDNDKILAFLDNPIAQDAAVNEIVTEVKARGIDGVSIDVEYVGKPDDQYRGKFSNFVAHVTESMHQEVSGSQVTVAVYALSAKQPQLYDIAALGKSADSIFMMAYDFSVKGSKTSSPTAPLYGHQNGKYSYDIATAVEDFLKVMPAEKLILGVPYYGYNYVVTTPVVKSATKPATWKSSPSVQTYALAQSNVNANMDGIKAYQEGWDDDAQVGWRAYKLANTNTWRMIFVEDEKSLGIKYDFAKSQNLGGVGIWALGFDHGHTELWSLLRDKFGTKDIADSRGLLYK